MNIPVLVLLGFAAWTLIILSVGVGGYRWALILSKARLGRWVASRRAAGRRLVSARHAWATKVNERRYISFQMERKGRASSWRAVAAKLRDVSHRKRLRGAVLGSTRMRFKSGGVICEIHARLVAIQQQISN